MLDVTIDGNSIKGSPQNISIETVSCLGEHETLHVSGTDCICQPGFYRGVNSTCTECSAGTYQPYANNESSCIGCPRNTFSAVGSSTCHRCPNEGVNCLDGRLTMDEGVWCELCVSENGTRSTFVQKPNLLFDVVFHQCEPESSCNVDTDGFAVSCTEGYTGPVCRRCKSGYAREQNGPCVPCGDAVQDKLIVALSGLVLLGIVGFLSLKSHKEVQTLSAQVDTSESDDDGLHSEVKAFHHAILLVLDYLQICAIISTMEINPFEGISSGFTEVSSVGTMSPARASAFQCVTDASPVQTTLIILGSPILVVLATFAVQALVEYAFSRREGLSFPTGTWVHSVGLSVVQLLNLLHMSVTDATLRVFDTYEHEIGSSKRASLDLSIKMESEGYARILVAAILSAVLFVVGYPLFVATYFVRSYARVNSSAAASQFSRMTGGYRTTGYGFLWDVVVILRKVGLLMVAVWVNNSPEQFVLSTAILVVSLVVALAVSPYRSKPVLILQVVMIFISCLNCYLGFHLGIVDLWESDASSSYAILFPETMQRLVITLQILFFTAAAFVWLYISPKAARAARTLLLERLHPLLRKCGLCADKRGHQTNPDTSSECGTYTSQPNPLLVRDSKLVHGPSNSHRVSSRKHHSLSKAGKKILHGDELSLSTIDASQKISRRRLFSSNRDSVTQRRFEWAKPISVRTGNPIKRNATDRGVGRVIRGCKENS